MSATNKPWSDAERWTLAALWDGHGKWWDGWAKALPGRTPDAIADKASEMGLAWKRPPRQVDARRGRLPAATHHGGLAGDRTRAKQRRVARRRASAQRETRRR